MIGRRHLTKSCSKTPISLVELRHLETFLHPDYYYSDIVIFEGDNICKILKSPYDTDPYFWKHEIKQWLSLAAEIYDLTKSQ